MYFWMYFWMYSQNGLKFVFETLSLRGDKRKVTQSIYWIFCVDDKVDLLAVFSIFLDLSSQILLLNFQMHQMVLIFYFCNKN
jgi:hypothetical protein